MRKSPAFIAACIACVSLLPSATIAQQTTSSYFKALLQQAPERIRINSPSRDELLKWQVRDPLSPYNGLILVWVTIDNDDVRLSIDGKPRLEEFGKSDIPTNAVAVISGGMWNGRYDTLVNERKPTGLVIASGVNIAPFNRASQGGVLSACGDDVDIIPAKDFAWSAITSSGAVRMPCAKGSMLQTNLILVKNGRVDDVRRDTAANRVAIGSGEDRVLVAGAFIASGFALSAVDFAQFIAAAAAKTHIEHVTMLNLDGACSAQIYLSQVKLRFGCEGQTYSINRILIKRHENE
jgi:Phosphodiester glycosidase